MPVYQYLCPHCGHGIELRRTIEERHTPVYCHSPKCRGRNATQMRRVFTPPGITIKGGTT